MQLRTPVTGHLSDPRLTHIPEPRRSVQVYHSSNLIDAQIRWEVPLIVVREVPIDVGLKGGNHICIFQLLDVTQEYICLRMRAEEHIVLRLEPEVQ
jgi:hypothetical protein